MLKSLSCQVSAIPWIWGFCSSFCSGIRFLLFLLRLRSALISMCLGCHNRDRSKVRLYRESMNPSSASLWIAVCSMMRAVFFGMTIPFLFWRVFFWFFGSSNWVIFWVGSFFMIFTNAVKVPLSGKKPHCTFLAVRVEHVRAWARIARDTYICEENVHQFSSHVNEYGQHPSVCRFREIMRYCIFYVCMLSVFGCVHT